jgi:aldehyde:ferredoxin oxidoreductase
MYGWHGRLLRVDLTNQKVSIETIDPKILKDYIGGRGLAIRYLYDEVDSVGGPTRSGEQTHLRHRPADRHHRPDR